MKHTLREALVTILEASNMGDWLESRLHLRLTELADDMFGDGRLTREERIALSGAIGDALDAYHEAIQASAPQLYQRNRWEEPPMMPMPPEPMISESFGEPTPAPRPAPHGTEVGGGLSFSANLKEAGLSEPFVSLLEKSVRRDGTIPIKLIRPGWGASGYYAPQLLERDGPKAFMAGTKMFWNHPTQTEEAERPERDLRDLAAELTEDAAYQANGADGPGLYANAKVFTTYREHVDELAPHIGVSINALAQVRQGEVDGRKGTIVESINHVKSVDFVTEPGAGGKILQLFEAARQPRNTPATEPDLPTGVTKMDEDLKRLQEQMQQLQQENARLKEANILRDARDYVRQRLAGAEMPDVTRVRLVESLSANPPTADGALDLKALGESVDGRVKAEIEYLQQAAGYGTGRIAGMGASDNISGPTLEAADKRLNAALASMGYGTRNGRQKSEG